MSASNDFNRAKHINRWFKYSVMPSLPTLLRVSAVTSAFAGLIHLIAPNQLLTLAKWSYDQVLAVRFHPRESASRRVRLIGVVMVIAAPVLAYLAAWME